MIRLQSPMVLDIMYKPAAEAKTMTTALLILVRKCGVILSVSRRYMAPRAIIRKLEPARRPTAM